MCTKKLWHIGLWSITYRKSCCLFLKSFALTSMMKTKRGSLVGNRPYLCQLLPLAKTNHLQPPPLHCCYYQTRGKPEAVLQTPLSFINSFICWLSNLFVKISLQQCNAQTVKKVTSSHKTIHVILEILYLEGHVNCCIASKFTAILLNGWILPTGGAASGSICPAACTTGFFYTHYAIYSI